MSINGVFIFGGVIYNFDKKTQKKNDYKKSSRVAKRSIIKKVNRIIPRFKR